MVPQKSLSWLDHQLFLEIRQPTTNQVSLNQPAILAYQYHSVQDVFRTAQFGQFCENPQRPCYLEDQQAGSRLFTTSEVPLLRAGALVKGDIMPSTMGSDDSDSSEDSDQSDTTAPESGDGHILDYDSDPENFVDALLLVEVSSVRTHTSANTAELRWEEIPWDYKIEDVFAGTERVLMDYHRTVFRPDPCR